MSNNHTYRADALVTTLFASTLLLAVQSHAASATESSVRFVVTGGLTTGGDTLEKITYRHGGSRDLKGGGLVQLGAGLRFHPLESHYSMLGTLNYHVDNINAKNGDVRLDRIPLEALGFYHLGNWQLGGGLRYVTNIRLKESVDDQPSIHINYKDTSSLVLQVGYGRERFWGGLRYVNESYKTKSATLGGLPAVYASNEDDASHVGLFGYVVF